VWIRCSFSLKFLQQLFNCIVCFGDCFYDAGRTHLHRGHPKHKKPAVSLERKLNYKGEERLLAKGTSIYVDRNDDGTDTGARYKKKSFNWYKNVIATNGEDLNG
jgi:hypothetical protein